MTTSQKFLAASICVVLIVMSMILARNKNWLWGLSMFVAMAGFGLAAGFYLLNPYTVPDLRPNEVFIGATVVMLAGITISYLMDTLKPGTTTQETQERRRSRNMAFAGGGVILFIASLIAVLVSMFGLAESSNGVQEDLSKMVIRIDEKVDKLGTKQDTLIANGQRREQRLNGLDKKTDRLDYLIRHKMRKDSVATQQIFRNQKTIIRQGVKAGEVKVKEPMPVKRRFWPFGQIDYQEYIQHDSLPLPKIQPVSVIATRRR